MGDLEREASSIAIGIRAQKIAVTDQRGMIDDGDRGNMSYETFDSEWCQSYRSIKLMGVSCDRLDGLRVNQRREMCPACLDHGDSQVMLAVTGIVRLPGRKSPVSFDQRLARLCSDARLHSRQHL